MLMPKRVKRRKQFRGTMKGKALRGNTIAYGEYGIVATEPCWIRSNQIEAARVAMTRYIKRGGKVWIKIFPDKPITAKPAETRMGSGKGTVEYWAAVVKPGRVMFEIAGVPECGPDLIHRSASCTSPHTVSRNYSRRSPPPWRGPPSCSTRAYCRRILSRQNVQSQASHGRCNSGS